MTVSSSTSKVSFSGNGSLTTFAYSFKIFDQDDLTVILRAADGTETVQTITTHYTVTGVGSASGGNVVFGTAPANGVTVVILREQPLTQGLDLVANDPFPAESLEEALDKLVFMTQKHEEELSRAIKGSRTNVIANSEFTVSATDRANKLFSFDSSGNLSIAQELGTFRGNWATSTSYNVRDLVKDTSTNNIFLVNTAHTSSGSQPLTTNANSAKYDLIVDAASSTTSQNAAASSATAAATSETNAANSATAAATSETNAANSATASASSAASAAASFDDFDDRYLGAKSTSGGLPTQDNDGNALIDGALFFDTTNNVFMVYNLGTTTWLRTTPTGSDQTAINTVNANATNINTVAGQISPTNNISTLAGISANITTVAGDTTNIGTIATDLGGSNTIGTVAGLSSQITTLGAISSDITTASGISADITAVANIQSNISTIAQSAATQNINTVAADLTGANTIGAVAGQITNVGNVGGSIANVNTVANNLTSVNAFGNQYVISANAPSSPNDGLLWFDTSTDTMKVYNGSSFQNAGSSVNGTTNRGTFTATANQTTFATAGYDSGYIDVYMNGVKQIVGTDVTATDGTNIVFASGLAANDVVDYVAYGTFALADHYNKTQSDARYATLGADIDFGSYKIKYSNVYSALSDLPSASTYHGMFAHVHATGAGYFAHAGNWLKLVNEDTNGDVVISGSLTVQGTQTSINSQTLNVTDKNITVANGAADAAAANDAGLTIDGANATMLYKSAGDKFLFNKDIETSGSVTGSNTTFDIVSANATVAKNTRNACDVSSAAFTLTLPTVPGTGDFVEIRQIAGDFSVNNLTVAGNGNNINGDTTLIVDVAYAQLALVYNGTEWRVS